MSKLFFTVGPTQLFPTVEAHVQEAFAAQIGSISHRSETFQKLAESTVTRLRTLMSYSKGVQCLFVSSGTEGMERAIQNCVSEKSFHLVSGAFSERFYVTAVELNKRPEQLLLGDDLACMDIVAPKDAEMICVTQNETSNGLSFPVDALRALRARNPEPLIAVDIVSAVPYLNLDFNLVDIAFFSVQKGFGLPAGLGVMLVGSRALEKSQILREKGTSVGSYHSFGELNKYAVKNQTPETPNVLGLYVFNAVLGDMLATGIERIRTQTEKQAAKLYTYFDERSDRFTPFVRTKELRSHTTLAIEVAGGSAPLIQELKAKNIVVGSGYSQYKDSHIRIGNFPAHSEEHFDTLLNALS